MQSANCDATTAAPPVFVERVMDLLPPGQHFTPASAHPQHRRALLLAYPPVPVPSGLNAFDACGTACSIDAQLSPTELREPPFAERPATTIGRPRCIAARGDCY